MNFKTLVYIIFMTFGTISNAAEKNLPPCPTSPNCVSSQAADKAHFIAPFKIVGAIDVASLALKNALLRQSRTVITQEMENTLHAEATSLIFRFVDDVDILLDSEARLFHIRSASRVGYGDFGVNRKRVENLRSQLQAAGVIE
ncbi:MAG: DUF1499 domain-containing protein [Methylococcaceae bacterium]|nr:DUF1499 domain-containing protein [Methylococcaceae bacterium]MDD1609650.1 DUF1499 domain-containing protein [Methylococcaceae bacterium]MDD1615775.1 DUF1499 domain-containing protein [Methylococcaceae bacterium]OYV19494.1 MAG: hypothetical protein CG439_876 [Methylococcaceae bacterium NSP1-2]